MYYIISLYVPVLPVSVVTGSFTVLEDSGCVCVVLAAARGESLLFPLVKSLGWRSFVHLFAAAIEW